MKLFGHMTRTKVLMITVLCFSFAIVAQGAFAALTFTATDITSGGALTLNGTAAASTLSVATTDAAQDLTLSVTGATDSSVILASAGTGADAIGIHATAGGIDIDTASTTAAALDIDATGTVSGNAITMNTTNGGIAIVAGGTTNGDVTITSADDMNIGTGGAQQIVIGNSTALSSLGLVVGTGNFSLNGVAGSTYTIGAATTTGIITIGGTAQTAAITIGDTAVSTLAALNLGTGDGPKTAINIGTGAGANGINIGGAASTTTFAGTLASSLTSSSTSGSTSIEPALFTTTMTGAGGVGGRVRAFMTTNVALGGWSNALKGEVTYGASGRTNGLGSAINGEMTLSAGTTQGNYAPLELELNLASGAQTGTLTSLVYGKVNGADASTFDTNGYILNLQGLTEGDAKALSVGASAPNGIDASLRIKVGSTTYYIPLYDAPVTN